MNVNLNISDSLFRNANQATNRSRPEAKLDPWAVPIFCHYTAKVGDVVAPSSRAHVTIVANTKAERDALRNALSFASHQRANVLLTRLARKFGYWHYWEIPSDRIFEALMYISENYKPKPAPKPVQAPIQAPTPEPAPKPVAKTSWISHLAPAPKLERIAEPQPDKDIQAFLMLDYLEIQLSWLKEKQREFANEAEVMEFVIRELKAQRVKM